MRRILLTLAKLLAVIAAAFLLCGSARAEGSGEYGDINSALSDAVPPEASEILEGGGITPDNNGAAALSFGGVLEFLRDMLMDRLTEPLRLFASLCGVVILCALSRSSADGAGGNMSGVFSAVGVLAGAGMTTAAISGALRDTLDVLSAASEFMLVFVPVFAGVIAAMGKAAAASAANTVILAAAQFFSQISVNFLTPVCGTVMGLSVTGAVHPEMSTDKLGELIRKAAVWGLSADDGVHERAFRADIRDEFRRQRADTHGEVRGLQRSTHRRRNDLGRGEHGACKPFTDAQLHRDIWYSRRDSDTAAVADLGGVLSVRTDCGGGGQRGFRR